MSVKFRVQSGFNFSGNSYAIVFNTSGSNVTPLPTGTQTNWAGYSLAIVVGGAGGNVTPFAFSYFRPNNTTQAPVLYPIGATPQQLTWMPNSNGQGTEFTIIFATIISQFNISATPTPSPTPTTSASASPTPTPTPSSSASPSPSPTASGVGVSNLWNYNFFVVQGQVAQYQSQGSLTIVDSLGLGGANDTSYTNQAQLDISTAFDTGAFYAIGAPHTQNSDALAGGDIANNP